jgi:hypothetical protein
VLVGSQCGDLGVPGEERAEQVHGAGFAVVEQEVAEVEVGLCPAHLAEVDNAAVSTVMNIDVGVDDYEALAGGLNRD